MNRKKCSYCKKKLPLFMFHYDNRKYQIKEDYHRCKVCRICECKKILKNKEYIQISKINHYFIL